MNQNNRKKPSKNQKKPRIDLIFHFIDPKIDIEVEDEWFDNDSKNEFIEFIEAFKKSIWIDKTYVGFEGTKYSDVFLTEDGWKQLCELLVISKFGKVLPKIAREQIVEAYQIMIICYLYGEAVKNGWDPEHIKIKPNIDSEIEVEIYIDETPNDSWKEYKGTWQELEEEAEKLKKSDSPKENDDLT